MRTFLIVCEEGGFSRAASRLHLTQPAVSYQMDRLEQRLGVELFERAGRRMILTPAGRRLHEFCARYFGELDSLVAELSEETAASAEPLRIAAVSGFGRYVLFPLLAGEGFEGLRLDLTYETADDVFERVEAGDVDLGIVYRTKVSNYLEFRELQKEELVLIDRARSGVGRRSIGACRPGRSPLHHLRGERLRLRYVVRCPLRSPTPNQQKRTSLRGAGGSRGYGQA